MCLPMQILNHLANFKFTDDDVDYLRCGCAA
jgi:nicotinic acid phosphoribosyltransferase